MPNLLSLQPTFISVLFSILLLSYVQEIPAQEEWVDSDNTTQSSETIKPFTVEKLLHLNKQELETFVEKLSSSHIESYVNQINDQIKNKQYSWWYKGKRALKSLRTDLQSALNQEVIKQEKEETKSYEEVDDKVNAIEKQLKN